MERRIYMTPRQPFFVTASETYKKYIMNRFGIVHFYQCQTGTLPRYAVPDGCVDMVFCCDTTAPEANICGTVLAPETVLLRSDSCYFGVRFLPGYNPVLGMSGVMGQLVNHQIPFSMSIDYPPIVAALKEIGYDGPLTIEREISGDKQIEDIKHAKVLLEELI